MHGLSFKQHKWRVLRGDTKFQSAINTGLKLIKDTLS